MCSTKEPKRRRCTSPMGSPIRIVALAFTIDPTVGERHGDRVAERRSKATAGPSSTNTKSRNIIAWAGRTLGSAIDLDDRPLQASTRSRERRSTPSESLGRGGMVASPGPGRGIAHRSGGSTMWEVWSGREDLNLRPHRPERCALPSCATPRPKVPAEGRGMITHARRTGRRRPRGAPHMGGVWPRGGIRIRSVATAASTDAAAMTQNTIPRPLPGPPRSITSP